MKIKFFIVFPMVMAFFFLHIQFLSGQKKATIDSARYAKLKKSDSIKVLKDTIKSKKVINATELPVADTTANLLKDSVAPVGVIDSSLIDRITVLEQQIADQKPGDDHFMVVGLATVGFLSSKSVNTLAGGTSATKTNSFPDAGRFEFSPMFLWRHGKKFLMEFEPSFNNGGLSVNWADISYFAAPGLILRAGYFVLPFGFYNKHLAAGWIGKLATDPIGISLPPSSDYGVEVEGGLPLGNMKWNYDVAITNGFQLLPDGEIQSAGITDNNKNKTFSGRVGILPFSNSSLELGLSALFGKIADEGSKFKNAKADMYALDLNYVRNINPLQLNIKAQYNMVNINRQDYTNPSDSTLSYTFDNKTRSAYAQVSIRPTLAKNQVIKNFELAFRYANFNTPSNSLFGQKSDQVDIGLEYWLSWRSVLKFTHETLTSNSRINKIVGTDTGNTVTNTWFLQFSIQL